MMVSILRRRRLRSSWLGLARVIPHSVGKCRRSRQRGRASSKKGGQAATLAKQTSWNRSMDEKKDTAVRHLKKQNATKYRNFVWSDCKLEYRIGRTAVTGRQRSESAGRFRNGFPKKSEHGFAWFAEGASLTAVAIRRMTLVQICAVS